MGKGDNIKDGEAMDVKIKKEINQHIQIKKFSAYGLLKNLKFFEPYLVIYLLGNGYSLFQIGLLYSVREAIIYIFEIPSGIIADYYGRKKELYMCFGFYIISFILFFYGISFLRVVMAMFFFGLGEAFRSGTHKAMIYTFLEEKNWMSYKAYVYGRTRSFSLIGSAISSVLAIILILNIPSSKYIFIASIIPYGLDLLLIMSYPDSLDSTGSIIKNENNYEKLTIKSIIRHLKEIYTRVTLREILLNSALFESIFKSVKDMIQPILELLILSSGILIVKTLTPDDNVKVILGITYGMIYIVGAFASKRAYLLKKIGGSRELLNYFYIGLAVCLLLVSFSIQIGQSLAIIGAFLIMYILKDMRKPLFVDVCDDYMEKNQRATVLSIESQLKSIFVVILAPLVGIVADVFGLKYVMVIIAFLMMLFYSTAKIK